MEVSIIIVNYNTKEVICECINSIKDKIKDVSYEIIVIDNNSPDNSYNYLKKRYPNVKFIKSEKNLGFGKANNLGRDYAIGKYLFLLNPDTILLNNSVKIFKDYLELNSKIALCGGKLLTLELEENNSYMNVLPGIKNQAFNFLTNNIKKIKDILSKKKVESIESEDAIKNVQWISGANMFIRTKIFDEIGGFDSDFFMYYEETEMMFRILKKGYKISYIPKARIIHLESTSFGEEVFKENKERMIRDSKYLYYEKCYGLSSLKKIYYLSKVKLYILLILYKIQKKNIINIKKLIEINDKSYQCHFQKN